MKVVILAGGLGTRLSEETSLIPKPMVEVGGHPIIWHIMKMYSFYGFNDFVIPLGYKGHIIKEYFVNYFLYNSDLTVDVRRNEVEISRTSSEPWRITLVDTGLETMTGGRVKRLSDILKHERFMLTYGDGVSDVNIKNLIAFHHSNAACVTLTAVRPSGRFGSIAIQEDQRISNFIEKPEGNNSWINGGFFVCEPEVHNYIADDDTVFEKYPLETLAKKWELFSYKHDGFWQCMDTLRDKHHLEDLWRSKKAKWATWTKQPEYEEKFVEEREVV